MFRLYFKAGCESLPRVLQAVCIAQCHDIASVLRRPEGQLVGFGRLGVAGQRNKVMKTATWHVMQRASTAPTRGSEQWGI